ncbi:hypothetical protein Taro_001187 [Colocasia esculenta]|uniref:Uncharacterized protein n=1 Tax=Colocasia esculenta TaxID=4460 RepID=A0A843THA2_COLES|nr:hypothetical protein [Colocasia esculenta]
MQTPDRWFCKPFLGAVRGGTVGCSSLTSWRVRGAGWFHLWALDLVESSFASAFVGVPAALAGKGLVIPTKPCSRGSPPTLFRSSLPDGRGGGGLYAVRCQ